MDIRLLVPAFVHAMAVLAPTSIAKAPAFPGWVETPAEREERYMGLAGAALAVAFDPAERPVFAGPHGRKRTAALLLGIAFWEAAYARDADLGPCFRGTEKTKTRCDTGHAACVLQIHAGDGSSVGFTSDELFADREKCFRAGLHLVRQSFNKCHGLNGYVSGSCLAGEVKAKIRMASERRVFGLARESSEQWPADVAFLEQAQASR